MSWSYPHNFTDGTGMVASGVQVDDNFAKAQEKVEALEGLLGLKVRSGVGTAAWSGGLMVLTVAHGLGKVPKWAVAVPILEESAVVVSNAFFGVVPVGVKSWDATNVSFSFDATVAVTDGAVTKCYFLVAG